MSDYISSTNAAIRRLEMTIARQESILKLNREQLEALRAYVKTLLK